MKFSSIILAITALLASTVIAAPWGVYNNVHADHDVVRDPSTGNIHYANPHTGEISAPIAHESQLNQGFNGGFQHHQGARSASWGSFWGSVGNALNPNTNGVTNFFTNTVPNALKSNTAKDVYYGARGVQFLGQAGLLTLEALGKA